MKKNAIFIIVSISLIILCGCGSKDPGNNKTTEVEKARPKTEKDFSEKTKATVSEIIKEYGGINEKGKRSMTPLHHAAGQSPKEAVELLIIKGADINARDMDGYTPLRTALNEKKDDIARVLINHEADVNLADNYGFAPLHLSASKGMYEMTKILVDHGADIHAKDGHTGQTPLALAAPYGHLDIVKYLYAKGAQINLKDKMGFSILNNAAFRCKKDIADYLISKGCEPDIFSAVALGMTDKVKDLIKKNPESVNNKYPMIGTLLHIADNKEIAELLISKGLDINAKNENDAIPLHIATFRGKKDVVEFLVSKGSDVNAKGKSDLTPLFFAVREGYIEIAKFLISKGGDINISCKMMYSSPDLPLIHIAAISGKTDMVALLLKNGMQIDLKNSRGCTAMHQAVLANNKEMIKFLIDHGADINAQDDGGVTPLDWALILTKNKDIEKLLREHGAKSGKDLQNEDE